MRRPFRTLCGFERTVTTAEGSRRGDATLFQIAVCTGAKGFYVTLSDR